MGAVVGGMAAPVTSAEVCAAAGITYRQLDFWVRSGYVQCDRSGTPRRGGPQGSGCLRVWTGRQAAKVICLAGLVADGYKPDRAAELVRGWFADERTPAGTGWPR